MAADEIPEDEIAVRLRAEFWRRVGFAVNRLPRAYPRRNFLLLVAESGNVNGSSRTAGISQKAGEWAWRRFLVHADLPAPKVKGSQGRVRGHERPNRDEEEHVQLTRTVRRKSPDQVMAKARDRAVKSAVVKIEAILQRLKQDLDERGAAAAGELAKAARE